MEIITRNDAIKRGLVRYYTGKPCKNGHLSERSIHCGCLECERDFRKRWRQNNREKWLEQHKKQQAKRREKDPEKVRGIVRVAAKKHYRNNHEKHFKKRIKALGEDYRAIPKWADVDRMRVVYQKAQELGLWVDHVVPVSSKLVCGLHCWWNLQLLSREENSRKLNREWPDMPE